MEQTAVCLLPSFLYESDKKSIAELSTSEAWYSSVQTHTSPRKLLITILLDI